MTARLCVALIAALSFAVPAAAEEAPATAALRAIVVDDRTDAPIPFASVYLAATDSDFEADDVGYFELADLPPGPTNLAVAAEGYRRVTVRLALIAGEEITIEVRMQRGKRPRNETVVVSSPAWRVIDRSPLPEGGRPSTHHLTRRDLELTAGGLGDPMRAVQRLPGVSGDEGSRAWIRVRSASPDELQLELDGIAVRHVTHATGIVSMLNRDLLSGLTLHSSGTPVDRPGGLGGGLYVDLLDAPGDELDGAIDLSLLAGSLYLGVAGPDGGRRHAVVVGVRQSFLGPYLGLAAAAGAFDGPAAKGDYGEYLVRYTHRPDDRNRLRVTFLASQDRLLFDDVNERHRTFGGALDWRWDYEPTCWLELQIAHSSGLQDEPTAGDFDIPHPRDYVDADHRTHVRLSNHHEFDERSLAYGIEAAARTRQVVGEFDDERAVPGWAWLPLADLDVDRLELNTTATWPEVSLWGDAEFRNIVGPLALRLGLRLSAPSRTRTAPNLNPRMELRLPLKWGTTISGRFAVVHQDRTSALVVDKDVGTTSLRPERAAWFEVSVDQELFGVLFAGVAGWHRLEDHLVVWDGTDWTNRGTGRASGLEVRVAVHKGRMRLDGAYALAVANRTNPVTGITSAAGGDQRHEVRAGLDLALGQRRRSTLTVDYSWRSGWAIGTLDAVRQADGSTRWAVAALDDRRTADLHRVSARFEHSHEFLKWRLVGSAEVAATPAGAGVVEDCPPSDDEDGNPPQCRTLDFLPVVMPWLGLRAEW